MNWCDGFLELIRASRSWRPGCVADKLLAFGLQHPAHSMDYKYNGIRQQDGQVDEKEDESQLHLTPPGWIKNCANNVLGTGPIILNMRIAEKQRFWRFQF
jgi:hypothetical protein